MNYYNQHMPLVKDQPAREEDLAPSLLEINAAAVTAAQEWETEWNTTGLPSRLSQEVGWKLEGIPVTIIVHAVYQIKWYYSKLHCSLVRKGIFIFHFCIVL